MTTPYIDPNLIFAENAPVQDKPAAFSNYDKGWDASRSNNGRPLIPQMNYLTQQADLKNLYIHENGAALPYKDGIAYEENAIVVKDGVLQQWKDGVWKSAVESELSSKADKTYVDEQDNLKADKATTYTKSEVDDALNLKADKTYVDTVRNESVRFYQTLAEANADIANLAVNQAVQVGESDNGGLWYKTTAGAATLTKSAYDPLTQAKADATTKANAAEANAKSYAENVAAIQSLSGTDIYYQAKDNPARLFQAIWQEYNKPVWYIGNSTFVDTTGATLSMVEPELIFTIKLTEANQTFIYPTRANTIEGQNATIDWGDGTITEHDNYHISHAYVGNIGDEFQVKVKGNPLHFDFGVGNGGRRTSRLMLKSIDKNTMPKTMTFFDLVGCTNLTYLCRGAYSSWINTTAFAPKYAEYSPSLVFHPKVFEGLESVTDISNMFVSSSQTNNFDIPAGLLDPFINVTTAVNLFRNLSKPLPVGILDKMLNLENVSSMFYGTTITSLDSRIFKNQTKLTNVSQCFRLASSLVADAFQLYTDMNQGSPTTVNGCFVNVNSMTNLASVPAEWKTL